MNAFICVKGIIIMMVSGTAVWLYYPDYELR